MLNFDLPKGQSSNIKVIGIGGGGNNAVNHMFRLGIKGVDFINCNTDKDVLENSPVPNKIRLGSRTLGAGANPAVGREAALASEVAIRELLEKNTKMLFITAGMGGGTGTGAAPVVAAIAQQMGILTVAIVTEPFAFEGKKRKMQAIEGMKELIKYVDVLLIINNEKLREQFGDLTITEAFHKADDVMANAAKSMAEIITKQGYVNVDFEDVNTVMRNSGTAILGTGFAEGEDRATRAVEEAITSPLLNNNDITGAKNILFYVAYGNEEVRMDEMTDISEIIVTRAGMDADVIFGQGYDEELGNKISVTVIATGFEDSYFPELQKERKQQEPVVPPMPLTIHTLNVGEKKEEHRFVETAFIIADSVVEVPQPNEIYQTEKEITGITLITSKETIVPAAEKSPLGIYSYEKEEKEVRVQIIDEEIAPIVKQQNIMPVIEEAPIQPNNFSKTNIQEIDRIAATLGEDRGSRIKNFTLRSNIHNNNDFSETDVPAFIRKNVSMVDTPRSSESQASRYCLFEGEDGLELRQNNAFLHDNVD